MALRLELGDVAEHGFDILTLLLQCCPPLFNNL